MKKIIPAILILPIMLSCMLYSTPTLGETNFPLQQVASIPISENIEEISVGDTWIAVRTDDTITAIDINTYEILWSMDMQVSSFNNGFRITNDNLVAASKEKIVLIDRQGQQRELKLKPRKAEINILRLEAIYPDYLYVFRGDKWILEAYDITNNVLLWEVYPGRPAIIYDASTKIAYVIRSDLISAVDNQSGKVLWEQIRREKKLLPDNFTLGVLSATLDENVLYIYERTRDRDYYRITAIDVKTQKELWMKDFVFSVTRSITNLTVIDEFLLANGGHGLIALDKHDGEQIWETRGTGEDLSTEPFKFDNIIYVMGGASATVFAISPSDGSIIGMANLEKDNPFGIGSSKNLYDLKDGILFTTKNSVVIYKEK
jgi:outer membrane protein assembly factor BamB